MRLLVAIALLLSLLVTIFAVQNNAATSVKFLFWSVQGSFALVLMVTLIVGILVGVLLMLPGSVRNRLRAAEMKRSLRVAEERRSLEPSQGEPAPAEPGSSPEHG